MYTNFADFRRISILVDSNQNLVIFPVSTTETIIGDSDQYFFYPEYNPIELKSPYSLNNLACKVAEGIELWNKYDVYNYNKKLTYEEKYYNIKGFKNAMFGKKQIVLGWDDIQRKYVNLNFPLKRGYGYLTIEEIKLNDDADYIDFAKAVLSLLNINFLNHNRYKLYKKLLNV